MPLASTPATFLMTLVALATPSIAAASALAPKPGGCTEGRFVVTDGTPLLGDATVLALHAGRFTFEGTCPASGALGRPGRRGSRMRAHWRACGAARRLRLRATAADCSAVHGTLAARGDRMAFTAMPSACGDGVVDAGRGEECDGTRGCSGNGTCSASCTCERSAAALECEHLGYPCSWSEVAPDVVADGIALAEAASDALADGGTTFAAAAIILAAEPAEFAADAHLIRFRLQGGRPVWLAPEGGLDPVREMKPTTSPIAVTPHPVVGAGRTAFVLDPFAWDDAGGGFGADIAAILDDIPDYTGNVAYHANTAPGDTNVDLARFRAFADHDVVYLATHGGVLCKNGASDPPCHGMLSAGIVESLPLAQLESSAPGLELLRYDDEWHVSVGADFFRDAYPHGLDDALVVLDACDSYQSDVVAALEGHDTNVVGWRGLPSHDASRDVLHALLEGLGQGRSVTEVYASMGDGVQQPHRHLVIGTQDVRIRELVDVSPIGAE